MNTYTKKRIYNNNGKYHYNFYRIKKGRKYKITSKIYHTNIRKVKLIGGSSDDHSYLKFIKFTGTDTDTDFNKLYPNINELYKEKTYKEEKHIPKLIGTKRKILLYDSISDSNKIYNAYMINRKQLNKHVKNSKNNLKVQNLEKYEKSDNGNTWTHTNDIYEIKKENDSVLVLKLASFLLIKNT